MVAAQDEVAIAGTGMDRLGHALLVHDLDGDGKAEVIAGAPNYTHTFGARQAHFTGRLLILPGGADPDDAVIWRGAQAGDYFGTSMATGDANGDGHPDLLIGAPGRNKFRGAWHLINGGRGGGDLLSGGNGGNAEVSVTGSQPNGKLGHAVALGDLNGDGLDDLIISEVSATLPGAEAAGRVLVFRGRKRWKRRSFDLGKEQLRPDLVVLGRSGERLGYRLLAADLDGDKISELIMGAPLHHNGAGAVSVIKGRKGLFKEHEVVDLGADGADLSIRGRENGRLGEHVIAINLDDAGGLELLMAEPNRDNGRTREAGAIHALSWPENPGPLDLGRSKSVTGLATFRGAVAHEKIGGGLAAGAINDGAANDLIIGSAAIGRVIWLTDPPGLEPNPRPSGYRMPRGSGLREYGASVAAGDLDGDGRGEVVVGAPRANPVLIYRLKE